MTGELVPTKQVRKYRGTIPEAHRTSLDTRIRWLWHQRFGTVQTIYNTSRDILDHTACVLILQAVMGKDIESMAQIFQRLEGGARQDQVLLEEEQTTIKL